MDAQVSFLKSLFDRLWTDYAERVPYARLYRELIERRGGRFQNDHVAFRTIAAQRPYMGYLGVARPFEALGYRAAGTYDFPEKKISSIHLDPPVPELPKVFISHLHLWELSPKARRSILKIVQSYRPALEDEDLAKLRRLPEAGAATKRKLLDVWTRSMSRPWAPPSRAAVLALEAETQFGAWTVLHGHSVNHFTAAVHAQGAIGDIERTVDALKAEGVPMKPEIEGARGTKLRQSSTQAAVLQTPMRVGSKLKDFPWPYAYFELAERPMLEGKRFEGFLGPQATNLFEMTRRS